MAIFGHFELARHFYLGPFASMVSLYKTLFNIIGVVIKSRFFGCLHFQKFDVVKVKNFG